MTDWRKPCEHGKYDLHSVYPKDAIPRTCLGGSPVTAADLEGLPVIAAAKLVARLIEDFDAAFDRGEDLADYSDNVYQAARELRHWYERLLIPIPDPQEVEP